MVKVYEVVKPDLFEVQEADMVPVDCPSSMDYGWVVVVEYEAYEKLRSKLEKIRAAFEVRPQELVADLVWEILNDDL